MKKELCFSMDGMIILSAALNIVFFLYLLLLRRQNNAKILGLEKQIRELKITRENELLAAGIKAQEEERLRIGQNLHDDLGSLLASLKLTIDMAVYECVDQAAFQRFKATCKMCLDKIVFTVRSISHNLAPATLELYGLAAAVEDMANTINLAGNLEVIIENETEGRWHHLPKATALSLFRVLEELLTNTLKHAQAQQALISFQNGGPCLVIIYQDDGKGMNDSSQGQGMGLANIKSRLNLINAQYAIITSPGEGFRIKIMMHRS